MSITHSFKAFLVPPEMLSTRLKEDSFTEGSRFGICFPVKSAAVIAKV